MVPDYYYSVPNLLVNTCYTFFAITPEFCPFFAPMVLNGPCRFCLHKKDDHRRYYIYSHFARKIQLCFFRFQFSKVCKQAIYENIHPIIEIPIITFRKFRIKYYRKWNIHNYKNFIKLGH